MCNEIYDSVNLEISNVQVIGYYLNYQKKSNLKIKQTIKIFNKKFNCRLFKTSFELVWNPLYLILTNWNIL